MSSQKTSVPAEQIPAPEKEGNLARSFNDYEEKSKAIKEKIRQRRVNYIVKDLPIY